MPQTTEPPAALRLEGLRHRFRGNEAPAIAWPDLELEAGGHLLLEGASGTGKSTLLHLIAGLLEPPKGAIAVGGVDVASMAAPKRDVWRGRTIGMIFQTFNLVQGFSALENVMLALVVSDLPRRSHRARAEGLLEALGIRTPDADVERLSIGQKQRIAVARALAPRPTLVLADEPTASLDPANASLAMSMIREACRADGAALLCASHDPTLRPMFDRHLSLDGAIA